MGRRFRFQITWKLLNLLKTNHSTKNLFWKFRKEVKLMSRKFPKISVCLVRLSSFPEIRFPENVVPFATGRLHKCKCSVAWKTPTDKKWNHVALLHRTTDENYANNMANWSITKRFKFRNAQVSEPLFLAHWRNIGCF